MMTPYRLQHYSLLRCQICFVHTKVVLYPTSTVVRSTQNRENCCRDLGVASKFSPQQQKTN